MPDLAFDLRHLKYVMVVAELGSFRRAAEALDISQSTVSRRILSLERRLGISLFDRNRTGTRPTVAGEQFIQDAAFGAHHLQQAVMDLRQIRSGLRGRVRVGVTASIGSGFIAELLSHYRQRFPEVEIQFEEASPQTNAANVGSGRLDAAIVPGRLRLAGCAARQLWREPMFLALPQTHDLAVRESVSWFEVRHENFIVSDDGLGRETEAYLNNRFAGVGMRPEIAVQRVGRENLLNLVVQGFGLTLTTRSTLGLDHSKVAFVAIGDERDSIAWSVAWLDSNRNPSLRRLLELCNILAERCGQKEVGEGSSGFRCSRAALEVPAGLGCPARCSSRAG